MNVHVIPQDDVIDHEVGDDCICGPDFELLSRVDHRWVPVEPYRWLVMHHSLDGREMRE